VGGKLFKQDNYNDAIDSYTKALEFDPAYSSAYFNRSLCYALQDDYELASRDAFMVMKLEPNSFDAPYVMGVISENKQDFEAALKWYDDSISKNPRYSPAVERRRMLH
jgi:tetratricopeptide (TPR) repeat protein